MSTKTDSLLLRIHKVSRHFTVTEIVTFGLIFYGLSIFLNRSTASGGLFGSMERFTGVDQEVWAVLIVSCVVLIRLGVNHPLQLLAALMLFAIVGCMWWSVWRAGLAWQGVLTSTICVIVCVKSSFDEMITHILIRQGKL